MVLNLNRRIRKSLVSGFLLLTLLLAAGLTAAAQTGTVSAGSATIDVGDTVDIPIIYDTAPLGLSGYRITVSLSNGAVADIEDVTFVAFAAATSIDISPDGNSVTFSAADFVGGVKPGDTNRTLARVTLRGVAGGISDIQVELNAFDGDGGEQLLPIPDQSACAPNCAGTADGSLTVIGPQDTIAPGFSNRQPAPGTTITETPQPTISVDIIDDGGPSPSGVNPGSITMTVTGCTGTFTTASIGANWNGTTFSVNLATAGCTLANGSVNVRVDAADNAGNSAFITWSFNVQVTVTDTDPPSFDNRQPTPGSTITTTRQPTISVDITDDTGPNPTGVNPGSITMTITGCGTFTRTSPGASWSDPTFSVNLATADCNLANGQVTVNVNASDFAGNPDGTSWNFTVDVPDVTPPSFDNRQPAPGSTTGDQPPISVRITDTESGVNAATIEMIVTDGSSAIHTFTTASVGASFVGGVFSVNLSAAAIVLAEGSATVEVSASDNADNSNSTDWSFTVIPPTEPTVSAGSASVNRGETAQIAITYSSAPQGLAGYLITVSLTNPAVADIEGVEFVVFDNLAKRATISSDKKSVSFRATDFAGEVGPSATNITLAQITFRGLQEGTSTVHVLLNQFDADGGANLVPTTATSDGLLTVNPGAPLPVVSTGTTSVGAGETTSVDVTYNQAPQGLSGYIITVSLASPVVADIEGVEFVVFDNLAKRATISADKKSVTFRATDFAREVESGDTGITLARITFRGQNMGTSAIRVRLDKFDADDGSDLTPLTDTSEGSLTVVTGPTPPTVSAGSDSCNVNDTVSIPITYNRAPQGLSGYIMTASLGNPVVAQVESVQFVVFNNLAKRATISADKKSVTFRATDFASEVEPSATNITLALITFKCLQNGTSDIILELDRFDANGGTDLIPTTAVEEGTLTVGGPGVDVTAPSFSNRQPAPGSEASLQPTISVNIIDDGGDVVSGVDPDSIEMTITGCGSFTTTSTGANWDGTTFAVNLATAGCTLAVGSVDVTVNAADNAGNSASNSWSFTASPGVVDDVAPSFSNRQPASGSTVGTAQPPVSVDIIDNSSPDPSGVNPSSITMTVTGCGASFNITSTGASWDGTTFSVNLATAGCTLADGLVEVNVSASDNADNSNSTFWSFTVSVPPFKPGDVNGDGRVDRTDANLVSRFVFTGRGLTGEQMQVANVAPRCGPPHNRSTIDFRDVTAITQVAIGIRHEFDCFPGVPVSRLDPAMMLAIPLQLARISAYSDSSSIAHFVVEGQGIGEIKVEVFNLRGMEVWESDFVMGNELAWHLMNDRGEDLANGVYLYIVTVNGANGEQIRSKLRKLVILR